jgi:hypothetical protein
MPVVGVVVEDVAVELVAAGLGHRHHRDAAELVELGLVVGGDHLVFGDAQLREGIAAAGILAGDAALEHVVLLPDAVDEDVDAVGTLRAAAQLAGGAVVAGREHHAGTVSAKARKLREPCGSASICFGVT